MFLTVFAYTLPDLQQDIPTPGHCNTGCIRLVFGHVLTFFLYPADLTEVTAVLLPLLLVMFILIMFMPH